MFQSVETDSRGKCTPAVSRYWLWLFGGLMWSGIGILLSVMACYWLSDLAWPMNGTGVLLGFGSGIVIYRFGFSRIAAKNINRIANQADNVCLFAFQSWRSYILIIFMMCLGYGLRHSSLPRIILAVIYAAIGTALTLSSSLYFARFF